jgi:hypothetical protein
VAQYTICDMWCQLYVLGSGAVSRGFRACAAVSSLYLRIMLIFVFDLLLYDAKYTEFMLCFSSTPSLQCSTDRILSTEHLFE